MGKTIVLALGGNAIVKAVEKGTRDEQWHNIQETCKHMVKLVKAGHRILITHGNGPQVGNLMLKNEMAKDVVPAMPLDVCVSNTQGSLGYAIGQTMRNFLAMEGIDMPVVGVITQVVVDPDDPAFGQPTKFVGPFFTAEQAKTIMTEKGHVMKEDSNRGWRRVVPSPLPQEIVEAKIIKTLFDSGAIVIAAGGGGIPVVRSEGTLTGVEAVIDKDMAGQLLAQEVEADAFFLLTDVERVCLRFGQPDQEELTRMTVKQARQYQKEGHFPPGSMGPKMEAALRFAESSPERQAFIVSLAKAGEAFAGTSGTVIEQG